MVSIASLLWQHVSYVRLTYITRAYTAPPLGSLRDEVDIVNEMQFSCSRPCSVKS